MALAGYPIWWEDTITLYNKYTDPQTQVIIWYRTVLTDCFWQRVGDKVILGHYGGTGNTTLDTTKVICRIPENERYLPKHEWLENPSEMENYFTVSLGDIVVRGEIEEEINEYQKGYRATDFIERHKDRGCIEIHDFSISVGTGKNNPHYHIKGV